MFSTTHPIASTPNTSHHSQHTPAQTGHRRDQSPSDPASPRNQRQRRADLDDPLRDPFEETDPSNPELDPALPLDRASNTPQPSPRENPPHLVDRRPHSRVPTDQRLAIYTALVAATEDGLGHQANQGAPTPALTRPEQVRTWTYSRQIKDLIRTTGVELFKLKKRA
ncbi:hypothetical protein PGTUg99_019071 [Puccinia graminis f. sp. tritici]|uniref:Uncharacterized protein n=1 Tax=Puccinia graminis f. sp. tritici TaxID=56615 RepID=A0A5B0PGH6_PUCGR|nr:hypothetical protein PGTUg99_019071 [Puccinia graminis f. sp. tritici]